MDFFFFLVTLLESHCENPIKIFTQFPKYLHVFSKPLQTGYCSEIHPYCIEPLPVLYLNINLKVKAIPTALNVFNSVLDNCDLKFISSKNIFLQLDFTLQIPHALQQF